MIRRKHLKRRPILDPEVDAVYAAHIDVRSRGLFFLR